MKDKKYLYLSMSKAQEKSVRRHARKIDSRLKRPYIPVQIERAAAAYAAKSSS
jgi:hypothetical protein